MTAQGAVPESTIFASTLEASSSLPSRQRQAIKQIHMAVSTIQTDMPFECDLQNLYQNPDAAIGKGFGKNH